MSLILHPQNSFTVVRQIANHLDTGTYYVRAVIRNAYTDETIATLDLEDKGGQRFKKNWQVPADPIGQGFYISIVTSVYSDSGYTTKSENYGDEENTYLVQDRVPLGRGSGGGAGVDYWRVREIIKEEIAALPKPDSFDYSRIPKPQEFSDRTDEILQAIQSIDVKAEKIEQKEVDLQPVLDAINDVKEAVVNKEVTPVTDLTPVLERLTDDKTEHDFNADELKTLITEKTDGLKGELTKEIKKGFATIEFQSAMITRAEPRKEKEELPAIDPTKFV